MKPLYKFKITNKKKEERKRYQYPPSLILSPITRIPFLAGAVLRRIPHLASGAHYCTYLKDTLMPQPPR